MVVRMMPRRAFGPHENCASRRIKPDPGLKIADFLADIDP